MVRKLNNNQSEIKRMPKARFGMATALAQRALLPQRKFASDVFVGNMDAIN